MSFFKNYFSHVSLFSRNIKLFMLGSFFLSIGVNLIWLLFNLYLKALNINETLIGNILSLRSVGAVLIALPASFLVLKDRVKPLLLISSLLNTLFFVIIALTYKLGVISFSIFSIGVFSTIYQVATSPFIMRNTTPKERAYVFGMNSALTMGAGILGSVIGGIARDFLSVVFMSDIMAYKMALGLGAVFSISAVIPFMKIEARGPTDKDMEKYSLIAHIKSINVKKFLKLLIPSFLIGLGAGITIPFINLYFKNVWMLNDSSIGILFALGQFFTFLGMMLSPLIAHRFTKVKTIVGTQIISIPFIIILAYLKFLPVVILAFLIRQALMNMNAPVTDHFTMEVVTEQEQPVINALKMLSWTGSWAVSASVGGYMIEHLSFSVSFTFTAIAYFIATILFYIFFRKSSVK